MSKIDRFFPYLGIRIVEDLLPSRPAIEPDSEFEDVEADLVLYLKK